MNSKTSKNKGKERYFEEALSWETDRVQQAKRSNKIAWVITFVSITLVLFLGAGIAMMLPLKESVPYVVKVDKSTGIVEVLRSLKNGAATYDEVTNKYWLAKYLKHRERYVPDLFQEDYYMTGLMTAGSAKQDYITDVDPVKNPQSPRSLYGNHANVSIKFKNISFLGKRSALIRYSSLVNRRGGHKEIEHWVATIDFEFRNAPMKMSDRLLNPLGFQILGYRNDPEVIN